MFNSLTTCPRVYSPDILINTPSPTVFPHATRQHPPHPQMVNWLRQQWSEGNNPLLADDSGLGKTASVLTFLRSLRQDFGCPGPVLVSWHFLGGGE